MLVLFLLSSLVCWHVKGLLRAQVIYQEFVVWCGCGCGSCLGRGRGRSVVESGVDRTLGFWVLAWACCAFLLLHMCCGTLFCLLFFFPDCKVGTRLVGGL